MTGHQPNPGTGRNHGDIRTEPLPIEPLVKGCGVKWVRTVDPYDIRATTEVMKEAVGYDGLAVVISEHPCPLLKKKEGSLAQTRYGIDGSKCVHCYTCVSKFSCPALFKEGEEVVIDIGSCIGCGGCAQVCPKKAIEVIM